MARGYPGINDSGNPISWASFEAACWMREMTLDTPAWRLNHAGSAWTAAILVIRLVIVEINDSEELGRPSR